MAINYEYREKVLKSMNNLLFTVGDENLIDEWFMLGVPDGADDEDFKEITRDEESYSRTYKLFKMLCKRI